LLTVHTVGAFLAAVVLLAIGAASVWPIVYEAIARTQRPGARSKATGALAITGYLSTGAGFLGGVALGRSRDVWPAFALVGALVAARALLQGARVFDEGYEGEAPRVRPAVKTRGQSAGLFSLIIMMDFAALSALIAIYGPFTRITLGMGMLRTAALLIPAGLMALASLMFASRHSQQERRFHEMLLLSVIAAVGALGLALEPRQAAAMLFAIPLAAGLAGIAPIVTATMVDLSGTIGRGEAIGTFMSMDGIGTIAGAATTGFLTAMDGPRAGMAGIGLMFVALITLTSFAATRGGMGSAQDSPARAG
jgi:predicted MFS family arabinose efflux permease